MKAARIKYWKKRPYNGKVVVQMAKGHNIQYMEGMVSDLLPESSFDMRSTNSKGTPDRVFSQQ